MNATPPLLEAFPASLPRCMDFNALLAEAMGYCQATSGDTWTDYNEHDPGLTILEQLCYALTDLGLRSQYPVADLLADTNGRIAQDTLFTGDRILGTAPLTANDYRKFVYDKVHGLKNFWLEPVAGMPGLYRGLIEKFRWGQDDELLKQVSALLRANRSLGEDVAGVSLLSQQSLKLDGVLQIKAGYDADEVMGAVLFDLDLKLLPSPSPEVIDAQIAAGVPLEAIFEGPLLQYGSIADAQLLERPACITLQQIASVVQAVDGVAWLRKLRFQDSPNDTLTLDTDAEPFIDIPSRNDRGPFRVVDSSGNGITLDPQRVARFFDKCEADSRSLETAVKLSTAALSYRHRPGGRQLEVQRYHSIQHQFPLTYGLGRYGIPGQLGAISSGTEGVFGAEAAGAAPPRRGAQVQQLRAYLLPFEQVLANGFAQLGHTRWLYSLRPPRPQSYFCQSLLNDEKTDPPGMAELLQAASAGAEAPQERWRYVVRVRHPDGTIALRSQRLPGLGNARQRMRDIARQGPEVDHYRFFRTRHGEVVLALMDAQGQLIAYGQTPYPALAPAQEAARQLAHLMHHASRHSHLDRHIDLHRQGAIGMHVTNQSGQRVLSANWPGTLEERAEHVDEVLRHGRDVGRYGYRRWDSGEWRFLLFNEQGVDIAEGPLRWSSLEEAQREARGVAELIENIAHDPLAFGRHVQLFPRGEARTQRDVPENHLRRLRQLVAQFDPAPQRRNAFLNHLLARFDECFEDELLQSFDPRPGHEGDFLEDLASWKSSFLMAYPRASARRGCGFNYGLKTAHPLPAGSGLEHRLHSLLGMGGRHTLARYPLSRQPLTGHTPCFHFYRRHDAGREQEQEQEQESFVFEARHPGLFAALLKYGTDLERYRIQPAGDGLSWVLHFDYPGAADTKVLADFDYPRLERHRNALIAWLHADGGAWAHLYDGEGLHVLEHILLRPLAEPRAADDGFYGFRISVLLPDWPVRFQSDEFKQLAERLIAENCPAHLAVDCHWLDFRRMQRFEALYADWAAEKARGVQAADGHCQELDLRSRRLREFLEQAAQGKA